MEIWFLLILSLSFCILLKFLIPTLTPRNKKLPPGPPTLPFLGNLLWLPKSLLDLEPVLRQLRKKYGPIITLYIGSRPSIFIFDRSLAHQTLIQHGATFADRPPANVVGRITSTNQHNINSSHYGPLWRLLRRNLISEILNPNRVKSYSTGREWVLGLLIQKFRSESESESGDGTISVLEGFQYAMFCLLLLMCFGQKLDEDVVRKIKEGQQRFLLRFRRFNVLVFFPKLGKFLFRKRWNELLEIRRNQEEQLIPLIRARRENQKKQKLDDDKEGDFFCFSYVDSLLELELPDDGGRKLKEEEIVTLCSEFLNAGTDTTSTALEWIMANLVKNQEIQAKLFEEIKGVVKEGDTIKEEDLLMMKYLKAVVIEGLRRHPPGHFVLPHAVSEEISINGYVIPKKATVNFTVAEMGWDGEVWKDPMEFKPERFLEGEEVDITGSREIKMMPFGAGRRICPGMGLAMLHLEYFIVNLVREFEWKAKEGEEVDLTEKPAFTIVMKNPLRAAIVPRRK
ncbi:cytochrome P450 89A2-like [Tasmannia lanceolata]|uniref:cytochrome P450 89A2-like n=1 Tax=Tasmannia lanceolata TaxID=3420 RepID=UPI004062F53A